MTAPRTCLAALLVCAAGLRGGAEDEAVTLQFKFTTGDSWTIDEEMTVTLALTVTTDGKAQSMSQTNHRVRRGELTVVKAGEARLDSVLVHFGADCLDTEQVGDGEVVKKPTALAGQDVKVKRKESGEASVKSAAALTDDEKAEARALLDPTDALFPKKPVKIGDRWVADEHALPPSIVKLFSMAPGDTCKVRLQLKELADVDGRRVAAIEAKVVVDEKREGSTSKFELAGTFVLDVASGVALAVDLRGTLVASGEAEQADENGKTVKIAIAGKGDIAYRSGLNTFPAGAAPAAGATSFGHMRFNPPAGWKSTAYSNGVLLQPTQLPAGGHLDITVMQAIDWTGTLDEALKRSWDEAAKQLALEETNTVDGTPYMKRQSGTSFKGWEYLLADGALRSTNGDYYVRLFLVKINGRVERILVASKERSYRGDVSCAQAPIYLDQIEEFFFAIQFDDWKDPVVAPATLNGDGIVGVWTGISMTGGQFSGEYAIFFANGQAYFATKFPINGLDNFNTWVDGEMRRRYWGTWNFKDGTGVMKLIYQEVPLRSAADTLVLTTLKTDHKFVKIPPPDGARFDGTWILPHDNPQDPAPNAGITFTPGGEFKDFGATNCLNHGYPLTEAPGEGTYEVRNYTLLLHFKDGREYRIAFPGLDYEKGNQRPPKLVLSFNEDVLVRK